MSMLSWFENIYVTWTVDHAGSIMTSGGNLAWSAANIGGPGKLYLSRGCRLFVLEGGVHCGPSSLGY